MREFMAVTKALADENRVRADMARKTGFYEQGEPINGKRE
jgi:hypothetical protein